jgi:hypothetical protein
LLGPWDRSLILSNASSLYGPVPGQGDPNGVADHCVEEHLVSEKEIPGSALAFNSTTVKNELYVVDVFWHLAAAIALQ